MCKHPDLLYVVMRLLNLPTTLSLYLYINLFIYISVCYSNLTKTPKKYNLHNLHNYQTIKQQTTNKQTNKQQSQLSYLINYRPLFATINWTTTTTTTTSCYNLLQPTTTTTTTTHVTQVGYTMRDIRYFWRDGLSSVGMSSEVELPQFRVLGHRQRATEINLTTGTPIH